ncbi:unnamed protein product [Pleuronectes platessa]|uniref:Uncharacterized protein n=1 Tax=Pleuronectes platessa TaxID=8262 RepID=A0A9N7Z8I3_PLEPL|nr:unnamed protein product [Pleuronectes platessa]
MEQAHWSACDVPGCHLPRPGMKLAPHSEGTCTQPSGGVYLSSCFFSGGQGGPQSCRTYKDKNLHTTAGAEQDQHDSPSHSIPPVASGIGRHKPAGGDGTG